MASATKSLLFTTLFLCLASLAYGLPLPRLVYQQMADPSTRSQFWELRPAGVEPFTVADAQAALFRSYIQGRFDPDRPYIQLIVPAGAQEDVTEDRMIPGGPFGPIRPSVPTVAAPTTPAPICKNDSLNETLLNGTLLNRTNASDCVMPPTKKTSTKPAQALFMMADGTTLYSVGEEQKSDLNGAYELAYVARRPPTAPLSEYPFIQYADYNQVKMSGFGGVPFFGSPYRGVGSFEPVYIYKPVYPTSSRNYDVYYYLPSDPSRQQQPSATLGVPESEPERSDEEEEKKAEVEESSEEIARTEVLARDPAPSAGKEEASEIAMANAVGETEQTEQQQQALVKALSSEIEAELGGETEDKSAQNEENEVAKAAKEGLAELMEQSDDKYWNNELGRISNKDLISAVEIVLQQLNSRLSN